MIRARVTLSALSLAVLSLAACGGATPDEQSDSISQDSNAPPDTLVDAGLWRGKRPDAAELQKLKGMGVRTIIDLEDDSRAVNAERPIAQRLGMTFISEPMSGFWTPSGAQVDRIETLLANPKLYPMFVHCQHGQDRTGIVIGLHRIEHDGWTPKAATKEMLGMGFHKLLVFLWHYWEEKSGYDD